MSEQRASQFILVVLFLLIGGFWLKLSGDQAASAARASIPTPPDREFCQEWLKYYESFCVVYPDHCVKPKEQPRVMARCEPGWDK